MAKKKKKGGKLKNKSVTTASPIESSKTPSDSPIFVKEFKELEESQRIPEEIEQKDEIEDDMEMQEVEYVEDKTTTEFIAEMKKETIKDESSDVVDKNDDELNDESSQEREENISTEQYEEYESNKGQSEDKKPNLQKTRTAVTLNPSEVQEEEEEEEKEEEEDNHFASADYQENSASLPLKSSETNQTTTQISKSSEITEIESSTSSKSKQYLNDPISLIQVTDGPYSLTLMITNIPVQNAEIPGLSSPTYIENYNTNIYIGTSNGEILHYVQFEQGYLFVSRNSFHSSHHKPIDKIVVLPNIEKAVVISGGMLSCFTLPEFSPANIGRIKDVWDISIDHSHKAKDDNSGVHVVVYSTNLIRIINITPSVLRLVKDISYGGAKCGVRRGDFSLVASEKEYDLIDLKNSSKIPLFPIQTIESKEENIKPFILPISKEEFLLTCGARNTEPSMGLVVNNNGDISRGTVPMDTYPHSIQIDDLLVIAAFDNKVVVYSLHDQSIAQEMEFTGMVQIGKLHTAYSSNNEILVDLIKLVPISGENKELEKKELEFAKSISKVKSNVVIYTADFIQLLLSPPRLQRVKYKTIEELETELKSIDGSDELGLVEIKYLKTLITLSQWKNGEYIQCFENLKNDIVDPRIFIYIMGYEIYGDLWLFNGLIPLIEDLKKRRIKDTKMLKFFSEFLEKWVSKEGFTENFSITKSIELTKLKFFINDDTRLTVLLARPNILQYEETFEILKSNNKNMALAQYYLSQHDYTKSLEIYRSLIDGVITDNYFDKKAGLLVVIELLYKHFTHDRETIKETGLWIMSHNSELGLHFFHNKLIDIKDVDEMLIISKIEDVRLQYTYLEKLLVRLNKEKISTNLMKNLRKAELKRLTMSVKVQKKASLGNT